MNGPLGFVCFSLGAGLATVALHNVGNESGADFRAVLKEGIRTWKTIANAAGAAQAEFDEFQAEVRAASPGQAIQTRRRIRVEPPEPGKSVASGNTVSNS